MDRFQEQIIFNALNEDLLACGDITSNCLIPEDHKSTFKLIVNEDAILAGLDIFVRTFKLLEKNKNSIVVRSDFKDGDKIKKTSVIATISGFTKNILKGERTALNFICHLSGIATLTYKLVNLIKNTGVVLLDTRKTTPGLRCLEKKAVLLGGGKNHRFNLSQMILIKDNHIDVTCDLEKAVKKSRKCYGKKYKIEVEVRNLKELKTAISSSSKPDIIMFDNWKVKDLKKALKLVPKHIRTEASGQISLENIKEYAKTGINYISTGYMIKNAKWVDFSLNAVI